MGSKEQYEKLQPDFERWMVEFGRLEPGTSHTYSIKLKFLAEFYKLDLSITEEYIDEILASENVRRLQRSRYSKPAAIGDFRAGLRKFLAFVNDSMVDREKGVLAEIRAIEDSEALSQTEKEAILKARIGQGRFRQNLIEYWGGCAVTGYENKEILIASHIKPWRDADNNERLDKFNGLLLLPNLDKLFDMGYMTFLPNGKAVYSERLSQNDKLLLGVKEGDALLRVDERHKNYLKYHNDKCFLDWKDKKKH